MTDVSLRTATAADIAAITRIYAHAVAHGTASFELEPPDEAEMARRQQRAAGAGLSLYRRRDWPAPSSATPMPGRTAPGGPIAGASRIRSTSRRNCTAAASAGCCSTRLIAEAEARGFRQMIAVIGDSANTASIELHPAVGFRLIGTFQSIGFKFGRWLDSVLMQRALGSGACAAAVTAAYPATTRIERSSAQHAIELVAAAHDQAGRRNHAVGALAARQPRIFLDAVDRDFRGAAEHREHRAVLEKIDGVIAPFAGGDHAAVEAENAVELAPVEGHLTGGGGRSKLAPAPLARFDFADVHAAPPLS